MSSTPEGCFSSSSTSSAKRRRRRNDDDDYPKRRSSSQPPRKKHLYLALADWDDGYSIHRLDADEILLDQEDSRRLRGGGGESKALKLPEPAALRLASRPMAFAALGTTIFAATNLRRRGDRAPPTLVYDTRTAALSVGPRVPDWIHSLGAAGAAMAVGEKTLYAVTSVPFPMSSSLLALSWAPALIPDRQPFDPTMEWCWKPVPTSPSAAPMEGAEIIAYAVHPDERTIFISTRIETFSLDLDTTAGDGNDGNAAATWKELGDWVLPFRGQAFFDSGLDAWVGLHRQHDGWVCCCPSLASISTSTARQPECRMLTEKLVRRDDKDPKHWNFLGGKVASLTYMGDSRFAMVENVVCSDDLRDAVIHVTLFGLKYNHRGELTTKKAARATRSYAVSKNSRISAHAAFWI